jgi:hypothetical protein
MKNLILLAALVLVFASCKKNSSGNITTTNTLSATIKGDKLSFTTDISAGIEQYPSNPVDLYFYAEAYDSIGNYLEVEADSYYKDLSPRTYGITGDSTAYTYVDFEPTGGGDYYNYTGMSNTVPSALVVITSLGSSVQGTFSGTLYNNGDVTNADSIVIKNGKFNMYQ